MQTTMNHVSLLLVLVLVVVAILAIENASTFSAVSTAAPRRFSQQGRAFVSTTKLRNYLDSLSNAGASSYAGGQDDKEGGGFPSPPHGAEVATFETSTFSAPAFPVPSASSNIDEINGSTAPVSSFPTSSGAAAVSSSSVSSSDAVVFHHAPLSYFNVDKLTSKGPRANADVGTPHDSTRPLVRSVGTSIPSNTISAGSWWCAAGGWPSLKQRTTTEIFYVLDGYGCLTDMDGARHYFGPGDVCILPKGWAGRWDIAEDIHKVSVCVCR